MIIIVIPFNINNLKIKVMEKTKLSKVAKRKVAPKLSKVAKRKATMSDGAVRKKRTVEAPSAYTAKTGQRPIMNKGYKKKSSVQNKSRQGLKRK